MAYTEADLTAIQAAIMALAKGKRVVSVKIEGKDIEYAQADLPALKTLRGEILTEINAAAGIYTRPVYLSPNKGL